MNPIWAPGRTRPSRGEVAQRQQRRQRTQIESNFVTLPPEQGLAHPVGHFACRLLHPAGFISQWAASPMVCCCCRCRCCFELPSQLVATRKARKARQFVRPAFINVHTRGPRPGVEPNWSQFSAEGPRRARRRVKLTPLPVPHQNPEQRAQIRSQL